MSSHPRATTRSSCSWTKEKQSGAEPYQDELDGDVLTWDGPTDHFAESRMKNAVEANEEIYLFYRLRHHSDFRYEGQFEVISCQMFADQPSRFKLERKFKGGSDEKT